MSQFAQPQPQPQQSQQPPQAPQQPQPQLPLQELNQEDLAAILPDQDHEDAPFDGFEDSESGRLVSKAIERMSLGADSDSGENTDQTPVPVYSSTLLQQFAEKTALLSEPRKRRGKLAKKLNDPEYACVSNVSPDSGIQSVNNSPLHLAVSPVSPQAPSQSPVQAVPPKPAVNVDRILYPPKRKPGRPTKTVSSQPRGPGRPKLKPEIVAKIEKIGKGSNESQEKSLQEVPCAKKPAQCKSAPVPEPKESLSNKKSKNKKASQKKEIEEAKSTVPKKHSESEKVLSTRKKCLSKPSIEKPSVEKPSFDKTSVEKTSIEKRAKETEQCNEQKEKSDKRMRRDKHVSRKESAELSCERQEKTVVSRVPSEEKLPNNNKKSTKENRLEPVLSNKKQNSVRKAVATLSRRVLKENKSNKKTPVSLETNVAVQTIISLPVTIPLPENSDVIKKCEKLEMKNQTCHHHKHRHHKHCRKLVVPPKTPVRVDPFIVQELESLIEEFAKSCTLGRNNVASNHSDLPQIFRVKKITKKRKGSEINSGEDQKLKRRPKKEKVPSNADSKSSTNKSSNSSSNEQRLPLKKRHYHVSSPHSSQSSGGSCTEAVNTDANSTENHIEEAIEATITRYGGDSSNATQKEKVPVTPKKRHRDAEEEPLEKVSNENSEATVEKPSSAPEMNPRRKKKIVKDLRVTVTKLVPDLQIEKIEKLDKSCERSVKSNVEKTGKAEKAEKAVLEKSSKVQVEKLEVSKADKTNLEANKVESTKKSEAPVPVRVVKNDASSTGSVKTGPNIVLKKKVRRRKAINRTGFPTLKKKKKKIVVVEKVDLRKSDVQTPEETCETLEEKQLALRLAEEAQNRTEESRKELFCDTQGAKKSDCAEPPPFREFSRHCFLDEDSCPTTLSLSKDSLECDGSRPCDKLCPVKFDRVQDSRIYDENATLEESLERYNLSQRIAELNEENLRKLDRSSSREIMKHELACNNNHSHKRRRGSVSPCNLTIRNIKRLKNAGYDTESDAVPSSDLASDDHDFGKQGSSARGKKKQPRWKKRYLQAGLFSDYFKEDEPRKVNSADNGKKMIYDPAEHPHGLLPPPYHCGKFLRQRKIPFQLPYDLWWLHTHSRLPGRDLVPSWNYRYAIFLLSKSIDNYYILIHF